MLTKLKSENISLTPHGLFPVPIKQLLNTTVLLTYSQSRLNIVWTANKSQR